MPAVFVKFSKASTTTQIVIIPTPTPKSGKVSSNVEESSEWSGSGRSPLGLDPQQKITIFPLTSVKGCQLPKWITELYVLAQMTCLKSPSKVSLDQPHSAFQIWYTFQILQRTEMQETLPLTGRKRQLTTNCMLYYRKQLKILSL